MVLVVLLAQFFREANQVKNTLDISLEFSNYSFSTFFYQKK